MTNRLRVLLFAAIEFTLFLLIGVWFSRQFWIVLSGKGVNEAFLREGASLIVGITIALFPTISRLLYGKSILLLVVARLVKLVAIRVPWEPIDDADALVIVPESSDGVRNDLLPSAQDTLEHLLKFYARSQELAAGALRRSIFHLLLGGLVGLIGLVFFYATLPATPVTAVNDFVGLHPEAVLLVKLAVSVPRIAILVFIEVTAGFFLKQYGPAMEEFRYYEAIVRQREALILVYRIGSSRPGPNRLLIEFSKSLLTTQPVGVLRKGETTINLEAQRSSVNDLATVAGQLLSALAKLETQGTVGAHRARERKVALRSTDHNE
jgi:hypothetical protein